MGESNYEQQGQALHRLIVIRSMVAAAVLLLTGVFYSKPETILQMRVLVATVVLYVVLFLWQWLALRSRMGFSRQLALQLFADIAAISGLVFATDGADSPFAFLFGLIVVVAAPIAESTLILALTVLSSAAYLCVVNLHAWILDDNRGEISALAILLQTSAYFLVGGVMAAIARRHSRMQQESLRAERRHRKLREVHDQVMAAMQEGLLILGEGGVIQDSNAAARLLVAPQQLQQGRRIGEVLTLPIEMIAHLREGSGGCQVEMSEPGRALLLTLNPFPQGDVLTRWVMTIVDLSHVRALERKLAEQNKLAALGRMAAMVAHEIRNPLQTIAQAVELMARGADSGQQEIRDIVTAEVRRLDGLISEMLVYARPLEPRPRSCEVQPVLNAAVKQVDIAGEAGVSLVCEPRWLTLDPDHLRLVVDNLLRNALSASPQPGTVAVSLTGNNESWQLRVEDRGPGLDAAARIHLFEPFAPSRHKGFGLGLATVWQVCERNRWEVSIEPLPIGSCFVVKSQGESGGEGDG